jgi:multiple sugar transport system permease protein
MRRKRTGFLLALPAFIVLSLLFAYPFFYNIVVSFYEYEPLVSPVRTFVGLGNYQKAFFEYVFSISVQNTLVFSISSTFMEVFFGLLIALLFASLGGSRKIVTVFLLMPMLMPDVVTTLGWRFIFAPDFGVLNYLIGIPIPWLSDRTFAMISVIIADVWKTTPFVTIILLAGILSISKDLTDSTRVDGANWSQQLRFLTLPHLMPFLLLAVTVRTIDAFTKVFVVVYLLTGGGPGMATEVLPFSIFRYGLVAFDWGTAATYSTISLAITLAFSAIYFAVIRRR